MAIPKATAAGNMPHETPTARDTASNTINQVKSIKVAETLMVEYTFNARSGTF
jgi:hypothetical protein